MACTATATEQVAEEIRGGSACATRSSCARASTGRTSPSTSFRSRARARRRASTWCWPPRSPTRRTAPRSSTAARARTSTKSTERLRADGLHAVGYHAGMAADERASAQHRFMEGDADVVVATNAFGMGVDKADVRSVIHWAIPKSVEAYYQEVGRGGRDGMPARAILLAMRADLGRLINFIERDGSARARSSPMRARLWTALRRRGGGDRRSARSTGSGSASASPSAPGCARSSRRPGAPAGLVLRLAESPAGWRRSAS